ncbi:MAG: 16S rRNA (uracil(1498)-N(3))-methyltransferase [Aquificae bacterium]|nr:16S rRNA (uracil(1498)-N(3))-methyltransferase [Aquificota bacterium]
MSYPRFIGKIEKDKAFIEDEEFHHTKVRRIKEGQKIEINDLKGNVYLVEVEKIEKKRLIGKVLEKISVSDEKLDLRLFLCMPNQLSKVDDLIEPISELGVSKLIPVISTYTAVKEKDIERKLRKWEKIALNSIKQCKRLFPLKIEKPIKLLDIKPTGEYRFVFYEKEKEKTLKDFYGKKGEKIDILIGAEGGLTEEEIFNLKIKGFETVSLGKNILRMETAVITAVCQVKFVFD